MFNFKIMHFEDIFRHSSLFNLRLYIFANIVDLASESGKMMSGFVLSWSAYECDLIFTRTKIRLLL